MQLCFSTKNEFLIYTINLLQTSPDRNKTTSVLTFIPTVEDGGKYLSCRGQQPSIPESGIEDGWKLDIYRKF